MELQKVKIVNTTSKKEVVFTHYFDSERGWQKTKESVLFGNTFYLGNCDVDGDMFVNYWNGCVNIYKGHQLK